MEYIICKILKLTLQFSGICKFGLKKHEVDVCTSFR